MTTNVLSYYITCMTSGMVELGSVFWGIKNGYSLTGIICMALAYQLGNILRFFVTPKIARFQNLFVALTLTLSVVLLFMDPASCLGMTAAAVMFTLFSTMLQNIRSASQGDIPRWQKRSCRVVGFVLSALIYVYPTGCMVLLCGILLFFSIKLNKYSYDRWFGKWVSGEHGKRICWAMVTHQAHYFAYNYLMVILVMQHFDNPLATTLWFAANWIPYTITEPLVHKLKWNKWYTVALGAHYFNAAVLLGMFLFVDKVMFAALCLWVLTGFGGGNVFCIKKALAVRTVYDKSVWSFSEQIGHVLGVISAVAVVVCGIDMKYSMLVGAAYALQTVPIIMLSVKGNREVAV